MVIKRGINPVGEDKGSIIIIIIIIIVVVVEK